MPTSALGVLLQVRGSSVLVGLSPPCPPLCSSTYVLGSPLVGLFTGAFRSLCSAFTFSVFWFCCSGLFFSLETPDIGCTVSSISCLPSSPCPLSLAVAVLRPSVDWFVLWRCDVLFRFLFCWRCRVLCVFCLWWVCVGGSLFFRHCLLNVCVNRRKVPSQHASPERLLFLVPSSCLVACRRSAC